MTKSVGIVGGGIIGTATALSLVRQGYKVSMIDPNQPGRAACYGNAGCLNPSSVVPVNIPGAISKVPRMILDPNSFPNTQREQRNVCPSRAANSKERDENEHQTTG